MKRIAIKLVVFGLLGAVVNVAVAWGCALWLSADPNKAPNAEMILGDQSSGGALWQLWELRRPGVIRIWSLYVDGRAGGYFQDESLPTPDEVLATHPRWRLTEDDFIKSSNFRSTTVVDARGWPFLAWCWKAQWGDGAAMGSGTDSPNGRRPVLFAKYLHADVEIQDGIVHTDGVSDAESLLFENRVLPIGPIWPGFALNTLVYALVLWLLWSVPFATRRLIRKRCGRCVRCGYDLTGAEHDVCPECGTLTSPLASRRDAESA